MHAGNQHLRNHRGREPRTIAIKRAESGVNRKVQGEVPGVVYAIQGEVPGEVIKRTVQGEVRKSCNCHKTGVLRDLLTSP